MNTWIRRAGAIAIAGAVMGVGLLDVASAQPVALTANVTSSVSARTVARPSGATTSAVVNSVPLLTCRVTVRWDRSPTAGVDGYEVRRVEVGTGQQVSGPWATDASPFLDPAVPLVNASGSVVWEVRALLDGWPSDWVAATSGDMVPCLIP